MWYLAVDTVCRSEKLAKGLSEVLSYVFAHCMGEEERRGLCLSVFVVLF